VPIPNTIPGIDKYPDLAKRYESEMRGPGCVKCKQASIIRKYQGMVKDRDSQTQKNLDFRRRIR
jgi:hypothetical protein